LIGSAGVAETERAAPR
jgi:hypothetical protein